MKEQDGNLNFTRTIETTEKSKQQAINETDYQAKTSHVHLASVMKAKNNGKNLHSTSFHFLIQFFAF